MVSKSKKTAKKSAVRKESTDFCKKCGSILVPVKKGASAFMQCRKCGYRVNQVKNLRISKEKEHKKGIIILEKDTTPLPVTEMLCPSCMHAKAYWWLQQTRASDEPPTQFFRCVKCKHVWREYK